MLIFRYESEFFQNVVNGREIVSWAAVDRSRPNGKSDELVGFVTARIVLAKESEVSPLNLLATDFIRPSYLMLFSFPPPPEGEV
jgi:hypothetical protein